MILPYRDRQPLIEKSAYVSSNVAVIGDVTLEGGSSVWFHSVVHGDKDHIHIGKDSNARDNCTLHTDPRHLLQIGKRVTVGHNAVPHDYIIEDEVLIGMGAIVLSDARIGRYSIIGIEALVKGGQQIPGGSLAVGSSARIIRKYSEEQVKGILENAAYYAQLGSEHREIDV